MRIARIDTAAGPRFAVQREDTWAIVEDPFAPAILYTGEVAPVEGTALLPPVDPRILVGIAQNLSNNDHPLPIQAWHKSTRSVAAHGAPIHAARGVGVVNVEGELALVIGRRARNLTLESALDAVLGYTIANDVTNVDQVAIDEKNFQAKAGANYTPIGPWIETEVGDPDRLSTTVVVNGVTRASSGSFNLPSSLAETLVYVTSWLELGPGDVVMTGAPRTIVAVQPGDAVEITIEGIGTLANSVV